MTPSRACSWYAAPSSLPRRMSWIWGEENTEESFFMSAIRCRFVSLSRLYLFKSRRAPFSLSVSVFLALFASGQLWTGLCCRFTIVSLSRCCTAKCPSREGEGVPLDPPGPQWISVRCLTSELLSRRAVLNGDVNQIVKRLILNTGDECDWGRCSEDSWMSLHLQSASEETLQGWGSWLQE